MKRELIQTSRRLLGAARRRPSQADLRRTVSTAYYAMFHALAELCADALVGVSPKLRALPEWTLVYRTLEHGRSRTALRELSVRVALVDVRIEAFCRTLDKMRELRSAADYDPRPLKLTRPDVALLIDEAEVSIEELTRAEAGQRIALAYACILPAKRR